MNLMNFIKNLFRKKVKVFAYKESFSKPWVKYVGYKKPPYCCLSKIIGPFRSEIDCEEFCSASNETDKKFSSFDNLYNKIYKKP